MRTSRLSPYYFLLQAFDQTGEAILRDKWTGREVSAAPPKQDFREIQNQRDQKENRLEELESQKQSNLTEDNSEFSPKERDRRGKEFDLICKEQRALRAEISDLPDLTNVSHHNAENFERREAVEKELRTAFKEGDRKLVVGPGALVEWARWLEEPEFKVDFYRSTVSTPKEFGTMGEAPAFISIEDFDTWVKKYGYVDASRNPLPLNVTLEKWLRDAFKKDPLEKVSRDDLRIRAQRELPGVSIRLFQSVWQNIAPESRRRGGRKTINKRNNL